MAVEVRLPKLSDEMEEGTVSRWLKQVGEAVTEGEPLVEVDTEKVIVEVEASVDGVLLRDLRSYGASEMTEGRFGPGRIREDFKALVLWVLDGDGGQRSFGTGLPYYNISRDSCYHSIPCPDCNWKIKCAYHSNDPQGMVLIIHPVPRSFRLHCKSI